MNEQWSFKELSEEVCRFMTFQKRVRAHFPRLGSDYIGKSSYVIDWPGVAPVVATWPRPLTHNDIDIIGAIGHWLNESFVMRLYSLLEAAGVKFKNPVTELPGSEHIVCLCHLRHYVTHGKFRKKQTVTRADICAEIQCLYGISCPDHSFALDLSPVLTGLSRGCLEYVQEWLTSDNATAKKQRQRKLG